MQAVHIQIDKSSEMLVKSGVAGYDFINALLSAVAVGGVDMFGGVGHK